MNHFKTTDLKGYDESLFFKFLKAKASMDSIEYKHRLRRRVIHLIRIGVIRVVKAQ